MLLSILNFAFEILINGVASRARSQRRRNIEQTMTDEIDSYLIGNRVITNQLHMAEEVRLHLNDWRRPVMVTGSTGSGKTTGLLGFIDFMLSRKVAGGNRVPSEESLVIIDRRGDLLDKVLNRMATIGGPEVWGERLVYIDLRSEWVVPFNPLTGEPYSRTQACLDSIKLHAESWGVQLEQTLHETMVALAWAGWSLAEVEPMLTHDHFRRKVLAVPDMPASVLNFFERYDALSNRDRLAGWVLPVLNKLAPLLSAMPQLRRMLAQRSSLPLNHLLNDEGGKIVLIGLDVSHLHGAADIVGSLLVSAIIEMGLARLNMPESERKAKGIFLVLDEFENLWHPSINELIQEGRRMGMAGCFCHQNLSQVRHDISELIINNAHMLVTFQTGASDASRLAKELSEDNDAEVRSLLRILPTGQAFVLKRSEPLRLVQMRYRPDPPPAPQLVQEIIDAAASRYAVRAGVVNKELADRATWIRSLAAPNDTEHSPDPGQLNQPVPASADAEFEIRRSKRPRSSGSKDER